MKLKYLTEDCINYIDANSDSLIKNVVKGDQLLEEFLSDEYSIMENPSFCFNEITLDTSVDKEERAMTDFENVKRIYSNFKTLSPSMAADKRIWYAYSLSEFLPYMKYRWPENETRDLSSRYLLSGSNQRAYIRNGISRLWWIAYATYDKESNHPFEITEYVCKRQDTIEAFCGRNIFNNRSIRNTVLKTCIEFEKDGNAVDRETLRNLAIYINLLGGNFIIDLFSREEISEKTMLWLKNHKTYKEN